VTTSRPCDRCNDPDSFGRGDVELLEARNAGEHAANAAAQHQHDAARAVRQHLDALGRDIDDLATDLGVGPDQLRRKLTGRSIASLHDLATWEVATRKAPLSRQRKKTTAKGTKSLSEKGAKNPSSAPRTAATKLPTAPEHIASWTNTIWQGDCIPLMRAMPAQSVDLILADLPYGTTRNRWDSIIPLDELWACYRHVLAPHGCVVLTAAQPFTSTLVTSNLAWFRYEWIWSKTIGSGQLNIHHQPLRVHESVLVFSPARPPYNPQMTAGTPYTITRKAADWNGRGYSNQSAHTSRNEGQRWPKSVLPVANPRIKGGHPTQKPVALMEYLIRTYTNEDHIVLDNVIGSGTTAEAARNTNRRWIGMELDPHYVRQARKRLR